MISRPLILSMVLLTVLMVGGDVLAQLKSDDNDLTRADGVSPSSDVQVGIYALSVGNYDF